MFIAKDSDNRGQVLTEAEELKPSCEVHGGNLFVQLHFKAVKAVPDSAELINTVVTSRNESSAEFSGCGKHLVAVSSTDEETPLTRDNAVKYIRAYLGTMFGQDVGNSLKDDDIHTIDEKGQEMDAAALKKWEEQQKEKSDENKESVDESIPSFGRFMLGESDDDIEAETASDGEEDEDTAEDVEDEVGGDGEEGEDGGDGEEDEEAGDELPPPATYFVCYRIKADGQPEKDHTDPKEVEKLSPKGGLKLPGDNQYGIKFGSTLGGGSSDEIKFDKLGKDLAGKVDSDEITRQMNNIMRTNFPTINTPNIMVRDNNTIGVQLDKKTKKQGDAPPEIDPADYNGKLKAALANSEYSMWIEVTDYREKPFVHEKDIADVINAAVKKVGGRWAKALSGVKPTDVFFLHGSYKMNKEETDKDNALHAIPRPSEIKNIIDKDKPNIHEIFEKIYKLFDRLTKANQKASDNTATAALKIWNAFKGTNQKKLDKIDYKIFIDFHKDYQKFYNETVMPMLSEEFISERDLMQEIFGILYEDDVGDEKADGDAETGLGSSSKDSGDIDDFEEDSDEDSGSGFSRGGSESSKEDQVTNIFIVPMQGTTLKIPFTKKKIKLGGLDVKTDDSRSW